MADTKISALTALTGAAVDDAADTIPIEDHSTTTTKKILVRELKNAFLVLATEQASTSGTSIDFTGIPAGVKRITIMFKGVSTNGTDHLLIQLGDSGGFETTGYLGSSLSVQDAAATAGGTFTTGFGIYSPSASAVRHGTMTLTLENAAAFSWISTHSIGRSDANIATIGGGSKSTSAELTQVRITTLNGSDAFDAGAINISYE